MSTAVQAVPVLDELAHCYSLNGKRLDSVTTVIRKVLPVKSTFEDAPAHILEAARYRGERVDYWACQYAKANGVIDVDDDEDVVQRMEIFHSWWEKVRPGYIDHQRIVWDASLMVCGKFDLLLNIDGKAAIVDLKCSYNEEKTWPLQLGGYRSLYHRTPKPEQLHIEELGALHIHPRFKHGFIYRRYDPEQVNSWWDSTVRFWKTLQELTA